MFFINTLLENEYFWLAFFQTRSRVVHGRAVLLFNKTVYSVKCEWTLCGLCRVKVFKGSILTHSYPFSMLTSSITDNESFIRLHIPERKQHEAEAHKPETIGNESNK